jgi:membrane protein YdbS with pleckstrin-like domain
MGAAAPLAPPLSLPSSEPEEEIWRGRFSGKALGHWWLLWFLWIAGLGYLWLAHVPLEYRGKPWARYVLLGLAGAPLLMILWTLMVRKLSIRYRLTTHRLFKDTGILSRHANEVELIRVDDVAVHQNLIQRLFNVGVVTVVSPTDQTEPRLELLGIENPIEVKEQIRAHVRQRRDRSLHVESL